MNRYKPSILFLFELKINVGVIAIKLRSFGFVNVHIVPAQGISRGIALCWKVDVDLNIIVANKVHDKFAYIL